MGRGRNAHAAAGLAGFDVAVGNRRGQSRRDAAREAAEHRRRVADALDRLTAGDDSEALALFFDEDLLPAERRTLLRGLCEADAARRLRDTFSVRKTLDALGVPGAEPYAMHVVEDGEGILHIWDNPLSARPEGRQLSLLGMSAGMTENDLWWPAGTNEQTVCGVRVANAAADNSDHLVRAAMPENWATHEAAHCPGCEHRAAAYSECAPADAELAGERVDTLTADIADLAADAVSDVATEKELRKAVAASSDSALRERLARLAADRADGERTLKRLYGYKPAGDCGFVRLQNMCGAKRRLRPDRDLGDLLEPPDWLEAYRAALGCAGEAGDTPDTGETLLSQRGAATAFNDLLLAAAVERGWTDAPPGMAGHLNDVRARRAQAS